MAPQDSGPCAWGTDPAGNRLAAVKIRCLDGRQRRLPRLGR
jgi:hypothetical protein